MHHAKTGTNLQRIETRGWLNPKTQAKAKDEPFNQSTSRKLGDLNRNYSLLSMCGVATQLNGTPDTLPGGLAIAVLTAKWRRD